MRKSNYREIQDPSGFLANLTPFQGNTMSGRIVKLDYEGSDKNVPLSERVHTFYVVRSYSTDIAWYDFNEYKVTVPDRRYSVTTSRQQNLCKAWLAYWVRQEEDFS